MVLRFKALFVVASQADRVGSIPIIRSNKKTASDRHFRLFDAVLFYLISSLKAFKMHLKSKKCKSEIYVFIHNRKIRALYAGRFTNNQLFAPRLNKFKNLNYAQTKTVTQFI
ncbi:MAG: hypothetical protein E6593_13625 [Clostridium sp.]|nr:hypothetical protein [Clostridium sp.]